MRQVEGVLRVVALRSSAVNRTDEEDVDELRGMRAMVARGEMGVER